MGSTIRNPSRRADCDPRPDSGFTLVEIIIALAVLGVASGIIMINLGGITKSERLKGAARRISGLSDFVRSQATGSQITHFIEYDFVENRYRWRSEPFRDSLGRFVDTEDGHVMSEDEITEWKESFDWRYLPKDVYFRKLLFGPTSAFGAQSRQIEVEYYPDGKIQSHILWLQGSADEGKKGSYWSILVNGLSGTSEVLEGAVGYPSASESDFSAVMGTDAPGGRDGGPSGRTGSKR